MFPKHHVEGQKFRTQLSHRFVGFDDLQLSDTKLARTQLEKAPEIYNSDPLYDSGTVCKQRFCDESF